MEENKHIIIKTLEEVVGDGFGRYSKYIIQDRAIPDARDGLKPVQRRILYAMHKEGNVYTKPYRKSAKSVGVIIGNYHPHGDSSVYDAMVRLSQDWKLNYPLVDMHGNNGSMDGDSAAAMRYTEARLSAISALLLQDVEKNTVSFAPNFDDTELEPTVLPAYYPNLLVNGSTGISAGYATDIPPHNLGEVIDAVILKMKKKTATLDELLECVKGPDFPTGGIIQGVDQIKKAYQSGKGRIVVRSKLTVETVKNIKSIVITELPYEVNKGDLVKKMDEIKAEKAIDGIVAVRDESDRHGLRVVVEIKKEANEKLILNYLYKHTNLQVYYNFNMVAIVNKAPKLLGLEGFLKAYIDHQREVLTNYTNYELDTSLARMHIVEGLMKAVDIIDEIIEIIRASKNRGDSIVNLVDRFEFSEKQASAIVDLRLYRLSNTDIVLLEEEAAKLYEYIAYNRDILENPSSLDKVIIKRLQGIKKEFGYERKSVIEDEIVEINISKEALIQDVEVMVSISRDGYIKRASMRSYASNDDDFIKKEDDFIAYVSKASTLNKLLLFFDNGYYAYLPVYDIVETKWKDFGKHINNYVTGLENAKVVQAVLVNDFTSKGVITSVSNVGMIKSSLLSDFEVTRYSKALKYMNLKAGEKVVSLFNASILDDVILFSQNGFVLRYPLANVALTSLRSAGVKAMKLVNDHLVDGFNVQPGSNQQAYMVFSNGNTKRVKVSEFTLGNRGNKGSHVIKAKKTNPDLLVKVLKIDNNEKVFICDSNYNVDMVEAFDTKLSTGFEGLRKSVPIENKEVIIDAALTQDILLEQILDDPSDVVKNDGSDQEQLSLFE